MASSLTARRICLASMSNRSIKSAMVAVLLERNSSISSFAFDWAGSSLPHQEPVLATARLTATITTILITMDHQIPSKRVPWPVKVQIIATVPALSMESSAPSLQAFFQYKAPIRAPKLPLLNTKRKFSPETTDFNEVAINRILTRTPTVTIRDTRLIFFEFVPVWPRARW